MKNAFNITKLFDSKQLRGDNELGLKVFVKQNIKSK